MTIQSLIACLYRLRYWLLASLLIVSIFLNFYLWQISQQYYLELNGTRLDPLGVFYMSDKAIYPPVNKLAQTKVVIFGDSRAEQWPTPPNLEQFIFMNLGINAQTSVQAAYRFEQQVAPLHPQLILVQVGINDLKTIPLFPELKAQIVKHCKDSIQDIIEHAERLGAKVILTTVFPTSYVPLARRMVWSPEIPLAIEDVNTFIRSLKRPGVIIFDTSTLLADEKGHSYSRYYQDTLHLNEDGYSLLNQKLLDILSSEFVQSTFSKPLKP